MGPLSDILDRYGNREQLREYPTCSDDFPNTLVGFASPEWDSLSRSRSDTLVPRQCLAALSMHDIYLLLRTISDLRAEAAQPEIDVRLAKLEREIEAELLESQESREWAHC